MGFGVWGLGFGVWGLGFGVWGLGFGVGGWGLGLGFGVSGSSIGCQSPFGFRAWGRRGGGVGGRGREGGREGAAAPLVAEPAPLSKPDTLNTKP